MQLILKAFSYTIASFILAVIFALLVLIATHNGALAVVIFPSSIFLGILAFLIDELKKRGVYQCNE